MRDELNADNQTIYKELKGMQRRWYQREKYLRQEVNKAPFLMLHDFLFYKLEWVGIPVVEIPCKNMSLTCNKCGAVREEIEGKDLHELHFKCMDCGYEANLDFNFTVNLCKKWNELIKDPTYELVRFKDRIYRFKKKK
jgi:IS605 OrfB family transposase